jgi:hypothetical protein
VWGHRTPLEWCMQHLLTAKKKKHLSLFLSMVHVEVHPSNRGGVCEVFRGG